MGMLLSRHYADNGNGDSNKNKNTAKGVTKKVAPSSPAEKKVESKTTIPGISIKDIKAMNGTKIRKLAKEQGIENPEELTVGELKAILCEKFS